MVNFFILLMHCGLALCGVLKETYYDYVIIGGGTSGLVVANRLSENPAITVAVIESGGSVFNNRNVTNTTTFGLSLGTPIDWAYPGEPQEYALNGTLVYHAGKALGGTSTINGMTYMRPEDVQINAWESLGNTGWNWSSLWPYYKKSERFQTLSSQQKIDGASYNPSYHGFHGSVTVGWSTTLMGGDAHSILNATWQNMGMPYKKDINGGKLRGFTMWPFTLNNSVGGEGIRQDAARAYYYPFAAERPNLHVYLNTTANRLIWANDTTSPGNELTASGIEVMTLNGDIYTILASCEVIISAGSLRSPLLLEHSGVGNPAILKKYSIPVHIILPFVGENLQDQPNTLMGATFNHNTTGYPPYVTSATATDLFGTSTASIEASLRASIPAYAAAVAANSGNAFSVSALTTLFTIQADLIFTQNTPLAEILSVPVAGALEFVTPFWVLFPFARGSVHIQSTNTSSPPAINPNFFQFPFDVSAQAAIGRFVRRAFATAPLSNHVTAELLPGLETVPANASDETWGAWLKSVYGPNYHPVGTAAMMARELGGVVDPELRVYGTTNVRVVDASILPFQVCGHLTSTLYAVAERAAEIIKEKTCSSWVVVNKII